jgi:hypothetical protein
MAVALPEQGKRLLDHVHQVALHFQIGAGRPSDDAAEAEHGILPEPHAVDRAARRLHARFGGAESGMIRAGLVDQGREIGVVEFDAGGGARGRERRQGDQGQG